MVDAANLSRNIKGLSWRVGSVLLSLTLAALLAMPATAQVLAKPEPVTAPYEAWFDAYFKEALNQSRTVGGAVTVVGKDGPVFSKGYGWGSYASREPIDPNVTYLPIADVGTVLISEMLIELAANKQITLNQPVNSFLTRVQLPGAQSQLTVEQLERGLVSVTPSPRGSLVPRGSEMSSTDILRRHLDGQEVFPSFPGTRGPFETAVLATLIEDVTGEPLIGGLDKRLSGTIGITPYFNLPKEPLPPYMVHHHRISRYGDIEEEPTHASPPAFLPSNGIALTLQDTGRLAQYLLKQSHAKNGSDLLEFSFAARNGDPDRAGVIPVYGLGGKVQTVSTDLILIPSRNVAVFVMLTGAPKSPDYTPSKGRERINSVITARDITNDFVDHWIVPANHAAASQSRLAVDTLTGAYVAYTLPLERPEDIFGLQQQTTEVRLNDKGALEINGTGPFIPMGPTTFRNPASGATAEFLMSPTGADLDLHFGGARLVREADRQNLNLLLVGMLLACLFAIQLARAVGWPTKQKREAIAAWTGIAASLAVLTLLAVPTFAYLNGWPSPYLDASLFTLLPWLVWSIAGLAGVTALFALMSWRGHFWALDGRGFVRRRQYSFGALGLITLVYLMVQTGMLSPLFI